MYHTNRIVSLLGLFALLNFFACDDPYRMSLETQTKFDVTLVDTFSITTNLVLQDSVTTSNRYISGLSGFWDNRISRIMVGKLTNNCFGNYEASGISRVRCTSLAIDASSKTTLDSIAQGLLSVEFDSAIVSLGGLGFHGDTLTTQKLVLERITTDIDTTKTYYINEGNNLATTPLTTITYSPKSYYDSTSKAWSIRKPIFRVDDLGREILSKIAVSKEIKDEASFANILKGFKIGMQTGNCINYIDPTQSSFVVYYHRTALPKVVVSSFFLFANTSTYLKNQWASFINYNLGSTALRNLQPQTPLPTSQTNNMVYLQDGIGLVAHVKVPALTKFNLKQPNGEVGKYMVNRAELYMEPVIDGCSAVNQNPPSNLIFYPAANSTDFIYRNNKTIYTSLPYDAWVPLPLNGDSYSNTSFPPVKADWYSTARVYSSPNFTRYIQNVMDGKIDAQNGFFIAGGFLSQNTTTGEITTKHNLTFNKVRLYDNNPIHGNKRMRLKLYLTKF